ncbi:MAG: fluoride efflux transporter CrcB [Actinobacteria bacterium]|jgi:fluoride exporter|nr:fluoride efflux transporter CrcB [Actinomycetota bacterium]
MRSFLFVGAGGAVGSAMRYWVTKTWPATGVGFPVGTFLVNVLGSVVLGFMVGYLGASAHPDVRLGLFVGLLGGFTTFSTFAVESGDLFRGGFAGTAALYITVSVVVGLIAAVIGIQAGDMIAR